mgnify:CR=1 FL=1
MFYKENILLIVSGGVAAYKSLELVRLLRQAYFTVVPVMTHSATKFVTPLSLSVLSGNKVQQLLHDVDTEMNFGHIELSRQSDLIVVAPATANIIAKAAHGLADDLASNILLATDKPVLMAPAMNLRMWSHKATKRNISQLAADGIKFVGPSEGEMACGEFGYGRMAEPSQIVSRIKTELRNEKVSSLSGKRILITSGPTEEQVDPVRYLSNRSTGIQGTAIAEALVRAGAHVFFVTGPVNISVPQGAEVVNVRTASEMLQSVTDHGPYDVAICAAAVSDWQMKNIATDKIKKDKSKDTLNLELVKTPDILEQISNSDLRPKLVIGFAAETNKLEYNAKKKLESKNCDWILANDVNLNSGVMGKLDTKIILYSNKGKKIFPQMSKVDFSNLLVKEICEEFE